MIFHRTLQKFDGIRRARNVPELAYLVKRIRSMINVMNKERRSSNPTSKGADAKLRRAINQLENVSALLRSMPKRIWKTKKKPLTEIIENLDQITEKTIAELARDERKKN